MENNFWFETFLLIIQAFSVINLSLGSALADSHKFSYAEFLFINVLFYFPCDILFSQQII